MEQGCPHRSILPHIFPDCNCLAIKIGGKFCGVRGVPRWGGLPRRCRRGGRQRYPAGGLPALPPANPAFGLISCPLPRRGRIDPRPPSRREGGDFLFSYARGFAPCIPGAEPGRHWLKRRGAEPLAERGRGGVPVTGDNDSRHNIHNIEKSSGGTGGTLSRVPRSFPYSRPPLPMK